MNVDERSYTYVNTELVLYFCDYCTSSLFDSVWFLFFHRNSLESVYFCFWFFVRLSRDWANFVENGRRINTVKQIEKNIVCGYYDDV